MKCLDCPLKYIGHTCRIFQNRCKEYKQAIRNKNIYSGYSSHILNLGYACETTTDTMDIIKHIKQRTRITLEKKHICKISKNNLHMNDTNIDKNTKLFRTFQEVNDS
jgi:hypothetical protein